MNKFRLALVTGATTGIGEAISYLLAEKGIALIIHGRNEERLQQLAQKLKERVDVSVCQADLRIPKERANVLAVIRQKAPDLVINNAGFGLYGDVLEQETAEQLEIIDVNITALVEIAMESARTLIQRKQAGVILNVASAAAFLPFPTFSVYAASKAFVVSFSQGFDAEICEKGIRVLVACPGQVATQFRFRASKGKTASSDPNREVMSAHFAAEQLWQQIQKEQAVRIFDWKYRLAICLSRLVPARLLSRILKNSLTKRSH